MSEVYWLTDEQWSHLAPLLPNDTRGVPPVDDRRVISGIVHVLKSGERWADAPRVYRPSKTLVNSFVRWAVKGIWLEIFHAKAHDTDDISRQIEAAGAIPNIPPKANRTWNCCFSSHLYRGRNAIKRIFGRVKDYRRVATRYDNITANFLSAIVLAPAVIYWL